MDAESPSRRLSMFAAYAGGWVAVLLALTAQFMLAIPVIRAANCFPAFPLTPVWLTGAVIASVVGAAGWLGSLYANRSDFPVETQPVTFVFGLLITDLLLAAIAAFLVSPPGSVESIANRSICSLPYTGALGISLILFVPAAPLVIAYVSARKSTVSLRSVAVITSMSLVVFWVVSVVALAKVS